MQRSSVGLGVEDGGDAERLLELLDPVGVLVQQEAQVRRRAGESSRGSAALAQSARPHP